ncbi:hypothetical protein FC093_13975 [Ilyomonas limi]|uniref:Oligosaccharide repeat unit polymerase n=1 Tax=Ilyomonas limi TaxID=2575867 RepID=A0A4U3KZZ2_9BACT|nr:hypothetical protein [Ilyomonas limi]TKK67404.1 hypothetical protein FC093_13975 [Ilyomonas limi]
MVRNLYNKLSFDYIESDILYLIKYILVTYLFCAYLKGRAIKYLVKVITDLAIISLLFYAIQITLGGKAILTIGKAIQGFLPPIPRSDEYTNFLFYTYNEKHYFRNSGFSWEPGAYGCFLIIGILLHLFNENFKVDKKLKILLIALLTTLSTTAYAAFFLILFMFYRVKGGKVNFGIVVLLIIVLVLIYQVPFLGDKITDIYSSDLADYNELDKLNKYYINAERQIPLNRFASILFVYYTFGLKMIMGISNEYKDLYVSKYNVNLSNGIMDFCAKFGLVGFIYLLNRFAKFCKLFLRKGEYVFYCILILVSISFGETILILPFFIMFIFLYHFEKNDLYYYPGS